MVLTTESIYEEYKEWVAGRKYILVFLIMTPVFMFIGALGGKLGAGIFIDAVMVIYMIGSTISSKKALKKLKKGDYIIYIDTVVDKYKHRSQKRTSVTYYIKSMNLYPRRKDVVSKFYESVEIGDQFAAVYVGKKLIRLYDLRSNSLSAEVYSRVREF